MIVTREFKVRAPISRTLPSAGWKSWLIPPGMQGQHLTNFGKDLTENLLTVPGVETVDPHVADAFLMIVRADPTIIEALGLLIDNLYQDALAVGVALSSVGL